MESIDKKNTQGQETSDLNKKSYRNSRDTRNKSFAGRDKRRDSRKKFDDFEEKVWVPKTQLGRDVLAGKYSNLGEVIMDGRIILESEITDYLEPTLSTELVNLGQAKGKFGGGKRKTSKPTQKKTREGNKMSFSMLLLSGDKNGVVGYGFGKARETVPSREKAIKNAKKNLIVIRRGCGDWGCFCGTAHSIPFSVVGRSGSVTVKLIPAPKGTGLVVESEIKKMLELAGIKDVWSKTYGNTANKINLIEACFNALKNLEKMRLTPQGMENRGIKEGGYDE
ncbi:MAG: 30S ribosomal protein S5 [Nanoarchaeota archaeon]